MKIRDSRVLRGAVTGIVMYRLRACECGRKEIWKEFCLGETRYAQAIAAARDIQRRAEKLQIGSSNRMRRKRLTHLV